MHTPSPFVSFCFTTYKRHDHLLATLESIRKQSFTDFEVIVSDNDPGGSGKTIVEGFNDPKFKYYQNAQNLGMIKSFNNSLELSSGEYIVMIADDDPIYPDMLQTLVSLRKRYPGYGMYLGGCDFFCPHHEVANLYGLKVGTNACLSNNHDLNYTEAFDSYEFVKDLLLGKIFPHYLWSTGMVKREILIETGGIPDYGTPFLGDYAYIGVMGAHSGCVIVNKSLGCQTVHNGNFGRNQNEQLPVVVTNFPEYFSGKLSYLPQCMEIKKMAQHFVALWVTGHMAFLHHYKDLNKDENKASLLRAEKEIFKNKFMKNYRLRYFLKKNFPLIHESAVKLKKSLKT